MYTIIYYKIGEQWFLDFPEYIGKKGDPEHLECIGSLFEFLEIAAKNETTIAFQVDEHSFEGANVLKLIKSSGGKSGCYYLLEVYDSKRLELELWFNHIIYMKHSKLPQYLYFKKINIPH